jgi:hypothetical protein
MTATVADDPVDGRRRKVIIAPITVKKLKKEEESQFTSSGKVCLLSLKTVPEAGTRGDRYRVKKNPEDMDIYLNWKCGFSRGRHFRHEIVTNRIRIHLRW